VRFTRLLPGSFGHVSALLWLKTQPLLLLLLLAAVLLLV
jgi:hypothetical protein